MEGFADQGKENVKLVDRALTWVGVTDRHQSGVGSREQGMMGIGSRELEQGDSLG